MKSDSKKRKYFTGGIHPANGNDKDITREKEIIFCAEQQETKKAYQKQIMDSKTAKKEDIIACMKESGLKGMGGAGFPTALKYETSAKIHTVIINGAECEPYLTCDDRLMREFGYEIINGAELFRKAAKAEKVIICLEDNKKEAAQCLQEILHKSNIKLPFEIRIFPTVYPQGGEKQLIQAVYRLEVPFGKLTSDVGIIVNNVATTKAMADAYYGHIPLGQRCVTVSGLVGKPGNYMVPVRTGVGRLLMIAGGISNPENMVIIGGPMTGRCIGYDLTEENIEEEVSALTSGVLVLEKKITKETSCIRCGECVRVCPAGISPVKIDFAFRKEDIRLCEILSADACIGCGSCSFICPAKRFLAYRNILAKKAVIEKKRKGERSANAEK